MSHVHRRPLFASISMALASIILLAGASVACSTPQEDTDPDAPPAYPTWSELEPDATLQVWPDLAPGETESPNVEALRPATGDAIDRLDNVTVPQLYVYKPSPETDTGASVLICPGGGYHILASNLEGTEVAEWLNSIGVTGIMLHYRVPRRADRPKHEAPLQDAQRAMRLARANADAWGIDPERIGILGFSAGGHLSAATATNGDRPAYESIDEVDELSCRPDFAVLVYPAYLLDESGETLAEEIRVSESTPPVFFAHAGDDGISCENSIRMYMALRDLGVQSELHVFGHGGHGFGLRPTDNPCSEWPDRCASWMRRIGLLEARP